MFRRLHILVFVAMVALPFPIAEAGHKTSHTGGSDTQVSEEDDGDGVRDDIVDPENAHPSGKDRSVEKGGSGDQGKSASDPDNSENGGLDKPGGSGGVDIFDQDYNNGCGNDDDFEDDNNGNCFGPQRNGDGGSEGNGGDGGNEVNGGLIGGITDVLGLVLQRGGGPSGPAGAGRAGSLAFTGVSMVPLAVIAILALLAGASALRGGRRREARPL